MLSSGCIATQSGVPTNPLACANLNLPHYGGGNDGRRINFGWVVDHPVASQPPVDVATDAGWSDHRDDCDLHHGYTSHERDRSVQARRTGLGAPRMTQALGK
jgi:hypothetical protein